MSRGTRQPEPRATRRRLAGSVLLAAATLSFVHAEDPPAPATQPAARPEARSLLGRDLFAAPPGARPRAEADLAAADAEFTRVPDDVEALIWVGRRQGYLWRMRAAIATYSLGIRQAPDNAALYRHRGHRYLSVREFDAAIADLRRAAELIANQPDQVEPDGQPNRKNQPLTTLGFNVWYHLGLAHYLRGDYRDALAAYEQCLKFSEKYADNRVATSYWMYLTCRRLGNEAGARKLAATISPDLEIIENDAYHRLLLLFGGQRTLDEVLAAEQKSPTDPATIAYGVGMWRALNGDESKAMEQFEAATAGANWPAFGFLAAEVELARRRSAQKP